MRISPNGKRKITTAQKSMQYDAIGDLDSASPESRPLIEQEDIGSNYNPIADLQKRSF
jgi:hypothetical protein